MVDREFIYKYKKYGKIPQIPPTSIFAIYGRMARSDAWKMFLCIFQDFDVFICLIFFENPKYPVDTGFLYITHSKSPFDTVFLYITYSKSPFDTVLGSLPPPRGLCACLRRFGDLRKNTSLEFWSMHFVIFVDVMIFE